MSKTINLICLPFAGGNKYSYRSLFNRSATLFNVITLEYPGRGSRMSEQLEPDINVLVDDLYLQVKPIVTNGEYAIYGHSLGGLIAYLLTVKVLQNKHQAPKHVFVTGASGPSAASRSAKKLYLYPHKEFIEELVALGGLPDEIIREKDMINFLEPILRNDFKASATYVHKKIWPLSIPLTVITGTEEPITVDERLLWQDEFTTVVDFIQMTGNHFFIFNHSDELINIISRKLHHLELSTHE